MSTLFDVPVASITGETTTLEPYKGHVLLVVNVASKCGLTPQYEALEKLYSTYKHCGFDILGFPANDFAGQEPGTEQEIMKFCTVSYNVTFPMFSKISVLGADKADLYKFLTDAGANPTTGGEIKWNFTKFMVDRNGKVIQRFEPAVTPEKMDAAVAAALK
jgi:glutathione peroxidase